MPLKTMGFRIGLDLFSVWREAGSEARHGGNKASKDLSKTLTTRAAGLGIQNRVELNVYFDPMATGTKRATPKRRSPNAETKGDRRLPQDGAGLWIDRDLLRRHMNPLPKLALNTQPADSHDVTRYLELADAVLGAKDQQENSG
jgi:hypothetical protein